MSFETENYGRYTIKSGLLKGAWAANGFLHKLAVASVVGSSRDEVVSDMRKALDEVDRLAAAECDAEGAPSATVYERAFANLLPAMNAGYLAMLRAHLHAPDHLLTATKLADAAGYAGYEGANLHYGKLAQRVAGEIGFVPPSREDGTRIWTWAIARDPSQEFNYPDTTMIDAMMRNFETRHYEWQMRPQVVQALRALGL
ncbi:hypothetical protein O6V14_13370 [Sphingomonas faeni]|uniref:hypothetical protein n=1 Tax=Sphingomonas faeni TaxID=185950 RepID=UPI003356AEF2